MPPLSPKQALARAICLDLDCGDWIMVGATGRAEFTRSAVLQIRALRKLGFAVVAKKPTKRKKRSA